MSGLAVALSVQAITQPGSNMVRVRTLKETMKQDTITEPTITRENATFVFAKVGELESEVNFAHIRISFNVSDLVVLKERICRHLPVMQNITQTLMDMTNATLIGRLYMKSKTLSISAQLQINCGRAVDKLILVEQIFQKNFEKRSLEPKEKDKAINFFVGNEETGDWNENEKISTGSWGPREIPNSTTTAPAPVRQKRFVIIAAIAAVAVLSSLALGVYDTVKIEELSSQLNQQQQIDHILVALEGLHEVVEMNAKDVDNIQDKVNEIINTLNSKAAEQNMINLSQRVSSISQKQMDTMERLTQGIFKALSGNLAPELTSGMQLKEAFEELKKRLK